MFSAFAEIWDQSLAHVRKEFHLQTATLSSIMGRLVVGPVVSLTLTGLLYNGVFHTHPSLVLGEVTRESFLQFICIGFLFQNFLNSGYYGFSARLVSEASGKTLSLIWLSPSRHSLSLISLNSLEYLRLGVITLLLWLLGGIALPQSGIHFLRIFLWLLLLWMMGLALGFLRACVIILDRGYTELMDHAFLLLIFTSCTYIPLTLLPGPLRTATLLNPLYHFLQIGRASWSSGQIVNAQWLWGSVCPLFFGIVVFLFWRVSRTEILDKSFS